MFKKSTFYRDDIWVGRYCAHPLVAWTHLLAGVAFLVLLSQRPAVDIGWGWLAFSVVPGVWLFITGILFFMRLMARWMGSGADAMLNEGVSLPELVFRREALSAILLMVALPWFAIGWSLERPFDQEDFRKCLNGVGQDGQAFLAKNLKADMPRTEAWGLCAKAYHMNNPVTPPPKSLDELQTKFSKTPD